MLTFFASYALAIFYGSKLIVNEHYSGGVVLNVLLAILIGSM
jgi:ATP-binding cassette subfamily B (MDR/TAP) protein 1